MKINKKWYEDKIKACWLGKNIGGTMGAPFEGDPDMQDIQGYTTPKGEPIPNDDLDLQLLWMKIIEERGIRAITPTVLSEYWIRHVPPNWNEYGVAKANLRIGLLPPLSGEYANEKWKLSNGAWIRTEIWACLFPGMPDMAVKYAYKDASVDHGISEGTQAAMFVAALESMAFFENDLRKLIDIGLSYIPAECRTAETVKLAIECYDSKVPFKEAREKVVEFNRDLGMFQAPANVAFVVLGLLYGEGDFKKSMILTINCGDDTDCTGATAGSIMALIGGMKVIPEDWAEYIGDRIISKALDMSMSRTCSTCTELTERIIRLFPTVMGAFDIFTEYTEGENEFNEKPNIMVRQFKYPTNPYTYDELGDFVHMKVRAEFDREPVIAPGETLKLTFGFIDCVGEPQNLALKLHLPEGWSAQYQKSLYMMHPAVATPLRECKTDVLITAGEKVEAVQRIILEVKTEGYPVVGTVPVTILG